MIADNLKELGGEIKAGDLVRLKSGGPSCTVGHIFPAQEAEIGIGIGIFSGQRYPMTAEIYWADKDGLIQELRVPVVAIVKV